jgi:hypothetical protein
MAWCLINEVQEQTLRKNPPSTSGLEPSTSILIQLQSVATATEYVAGQAPHYAFILQISE